MSAHPGTDAIRIRAAFLSDAPRLAELSGQLGYPSTPEEVERRLHSIQAEAEHSVFVAELTGDGVVGFLDIFVMRTVESDPRAEVSGLVVSESCRSRGVGRRLMGRAEQWAVEKGCRIVNLRSNVIRERAHAFYEGLGYKLIKTQKAFRKVL